MKNLGLLQLLSCARKSLASRLASRGTVIATSLSVSTEYSGVAGVLRTTIGVAGVERSEPPANAQERSIY
jgi:hypothetical protein